LPGNDNLRILEKLEQFVSTVKKIDVSDKCGT